MRSRSGALWALAALVSSLLTDRPPGPPGGAVFPSAAVADACGPPQPGSHEPAGLTCIGHNPFDQIGTASWGQDAAPGVQLKIVDGSGLSGGSTKGLRIRFPENSAPGAQGPVGYRAWPTGAAGYATVYLSFHVKIPRTWPGRVTSIDHAVVLTSGVPPDLPLSLGLYLDKAPNLVPGLRVRGLRTAFQGTTSPSLQPNLAPGIRLPADEWHRWEILINTDQGGTPNGTLAWWIDGNPMGSYSGFDFWSSDNPAIWRIDWQVILPKKPLPGPLTVLLDQLRIAGLSSTGLVAALVIDPKVVTLAPGENITFTASGRRLDGTAVALPVVFRATGGSITRTGDYHAGANPGAFQVSARLFGGTLSDAATVTITGPAGLDEVRVVNGAAVTAGLSGPETVLLIDARRSAADAGAADPCANDLRMTGLAAQFQDLLAQDGTCKAADGATTMLDEIAVFSVDDSVVIDRGAGNAGSIWSGSRGEIRTQDLRGGGRRNVPLKIWLAAPSAGALIDNDIKEASRFFNESRVGLMFTRHGPAATVPSSVTTKWCAPSLPASAYFVEGMINVYYVAELAPPEGGQAPRGLHCRDVDWNVIYMSVDLHHVTTLAHELGHAFGLEHSGEGNSCGGGPWYGTAFPQDNLMWSGCTGGATFSMGQAYRMNIEELSLVLRNGIRSGPSRRCECRFSAMECAPPIEGEDDDMFRHRNWQTFRNQSSVDAECPAVFKSF